MKVEIKEIIDKYNIKDEKIREKLEMFMLKLPEDEGYNEHIATYYARTWGSCRRWKLVVTSDGEFLPGEWLDRSSKKNVRKYKFTKITDVLGKELEVFMSARESCSRSSMYSFRVIAVISQN